MDNICEWEDQEELVGSKFGVLEAAGQEFSMSENTIGCGIGVQHMSSVCGAMVNVMVLRADAF